MGSGGGMSQQDRNKKAWADLGYNEEVGARYQDYLTSKGMAWDVSGRSKSEFDQLEKVRATEKEYKDAQAAITQNEDNAAQISAAVRSKGPGRRPTILTSPFAATNTPGIGGSSRKMAIGL